MTVVEHADALFAQGLDLVRRFRPTQAEPLLRRALELLEGDADAEVSPSRVMITLAYVEAEQGRLEVGLDLLEQATARAAQDTALAGLAQSQRGLLFLRAGRHQEARRALDQALAHLADDPEHSATVHLNRGLLLLTLGATAEAMADFERSAAVATEIGVDDLAALARHNLGYLALLAGDLPRALREMDAAAAAMPHRDDGEHVLLLDRARVLHACGMFEDAEATLERVASLLNPRTHGQDLGEAELLRAQNAMHLGDADQAQRLAARAARRFGRRGSRAWQDLARLAQLRARAQAGAAVRAPDVLDVARRLREQGLREDSRLARALAAEVDPQHRPPVPSRTDGVLTRLYVHQVAAEQAMGRGDRVRALRRARDGLDELQSFQAGVGSLDLQAAVTGHGRRLAGLGLDCALEQGRPATVFAWAERARALASRLAPVTPPDDPDAAALLSALRLARRRLREASLGGHDDRSLRARCAELEREVRERSWRRSGPARVLRPAGLEEVRAGLGDDVLVAHLVRPHGCFALVVGPGGASVTSLGPTQALLEEIRRVRADLDALALKGIPAALRRSVADSLARGLAALSHALLDPLPAHARRGRLVLLPSDELLAVPWPLLPGARGRPLTVARSATAWMRAEADGDPAAAPLPPLLVSGPDLDQAEAEIAAVARSWPGADVLLGRRARGEQVLAAMAGRDLVHLAAHGVHESANPLFSALRLADGPLFGYDLGRCTPLPRDVVLSACDLGLSTPSSQGERLGMTAALLHGGVRSVVASVARVGDAEAGEAMIAHHERLASGSPPAEALAQALASPDLLTPFVCFGRGW